MENLLESTTYTYDSAGRLFIVTRTGQSPLTEVYWYADDGVRERVFCGAGHLDDALTWLTGTTRPGMPRRWKSGRGLAGQAAWPAAT